MLAFQAASRTDAHDLPVDELDRLQGRLMAELDLRSAQYAAHETAARQLRDLTDADSVLERELAEAGARRAREALTEIEHALGRLRDGTYGRCEACGAPVPFERLDAVPSARFCVACPGRRARWR